MAYFLVLDSEFMRLKYKVRYILLLMILTLMFCLYA